MSISDSVGGNQRTIFKECLQKQLDEIDMLSSIFCNSGEIQIYDPGVISDFNEFINDDNELQLNPKMQLDFSIYIQNELKDKIEIHINLPHLYPILENAVVTIRTAFPSKLKEIEVKNEIEKYINSNDVDKNEPYIYQVITWIQDSLNNFLSNTLITTDELQSADDLSNINLTNQISSLSISTNTDINLVHFERLWIISHHIRNKTKRQEIVRNARELNLSGFSKPGKPGVICVEGIKENTQQYWKIIKSMNWQKIQLKLSEVKKKNINDIDKFRRFNGFKEELDTEMEDEGFAPMSMSLFMKFLDSHKSGYIRKEIFGFD